MRQAGFNKDELRERGWTFSNHLWNASPLIKMQSLGSLPKLVPVGPASHSGYKRPKYERHLISETKLHTTRYEIFWEKTLEYTFTILGTFL